MIQRNEYVLKSMFGSFFLATVASAMIGQIGGITDSIIVGNLVSPDALSAVRVWQPVSSVMLIIIGLMSSGAGFLSARSIGGQDYGKANRVFNHHLYYVVGSALLITCLILPFLDTVAGLLTTDERLLPMLKPYIQADLFCIFVAAVCGVPMSYIIVNGNPRLITRRVIISQLLNVVFDLLLCGVFDMGLVGASYATALSNLLAFTSLVGYMRKNSRIFRLWRPDRICSAGLYRECFVIGLPMLFAALLGPVLAYVMNSVVVNRMGADGMYAFTIYFQFNSICMLALAGTNNAIGSIGGILIGEEDYDSFRLLIYRIFRMLIVVMLVMSLLVYLFPDILARLYGAEGSLIDQCRTPFRLMCLALLPDALASTLFITYFVQGHHRLCRWLKMAIDLIAILTVVVIGSYGPQYIWYILPVNAWIGLLLIVTMAYVAHRRNTLYGWPTLMNTLPSNPSVTFSVPYTPEGVEECLTQVRPFVEACELPDGMAVAVALEELLYEIVETHAEHEHQKDETFDVRIIDKETVFTVMLKDKGPLRNPIYKYTDKEVLDLDDGNMRRAILSRVCKIINHEYMNGINCIYLNYSRNDSMS